MKYKPNATTQPLTQKEDGIQEKPRNPLYSDILKCKKSNTTLKRKTSESNTLANKPKITIKINFIHEPNSRRITETANKTTSIGSARPKRQL